MPKRREMNTGIFRWKRIGLGVGVGVLTLLSLTAAGAALMDGEIVSLEWMNYLAVAILLLSSFVGALTARSGENRWAGPLTAGAAMWLFLLTVNALGYEGNLSGAGVTALAILGGAGSASLLGRTGRRRSGARRKYRHR